MIIADGESYCNAKEAATYLSIKRSMFYNNVRSQVKTYRIGAGRRLFYKITDLEVFRGIQQVAS